MKEMRMIDEDEDDRLNAWTALCSVPGIGVLG